MSTTESITSIGDQITKDGSSGYKAEKERYHLYVSLGCPFAHRFVLFILNCATLYIVLQYCYLLFWFFLFFFLRFRLQMLAGMLLWRAHLYTQLLVGPKPVPPAPEANVLQLWHESLFIIIYWCTCTYKIVLISSHSSPLG